MMHLILEKSITCNSKLKKRLKSRLEAAEKRIIVLEYIMMEIFQMEAWIENKKQKLNMKSG